ncbi:MAG: chorismate-binding protein, partial [Flavobacteriales bacterium]
MFTLIPDASGTSTFHFAPFDVAGAPEISWRGHAVRTTPPAPGTLPHISTPAMPDTSRTEHMGNVEAALDAIRIGAIDKVVVSRTRVSVDAAAPELAFTNLCALHPHALVYLMHHPVEGTWCGATPELLLRAQQHDVDTVSLAGTRRKGSDEAWTDKERQEQQVVTDHVLEVLEKLGAEDVN